MNKSFLIVVDAYSKWAEVIEMKQTITDRTIAALRHLFSSHGIPVQIVSDNGPQFTSSDFAKFLKQNGIKHSRTSPYHLASNGEAERFVRTFKEAMKAGKNDGLILSHRLSSFLLSYRTTPYSTTGVPPCELLMGRHLRTRFDLLKPDLQRTVHNHQTRQKARHDRSAQLRQFNTGQSVMVRNFGSGANWIAGVIVRQEGPVTYVVEVSDGRLWKRHVDHVKECHFTLDSSTTASDSDIDVDVPSAPNSTDTSDMDTQPDPPSDQVSSDSSVTTPMPPEGTVVTPETNSPPPRRYPSRAHRPPERFDVQTW